MDRRNGGDPLAPPRPPKSLPRVHRPRAPEPPMMSAPLSPIQQHQQQQQQQQQRQQQQQQICTNNHQSRNISNIHNNNSSISSNNNSSNIVISRSNSNISHNSVNNNNNVITANISSPITAPLIPLQLQHQQHQTFNVSNNSLSSTTITSTNSFTRRRPPPPISNLPLLPSISSNIIHNTESPVSPVTLAAPRPESERLANEYVDTPFRTTQQLLQASRIQHPAGQTIHGQTTTQHNLLLQHTQRQQQQQQQNQQLQHHNSNFHQSSNNNTVISGTTGPPPSGIGGTSSTLLHSNINSHKNSSTTTPSIGTAQTTTTSSTTLLLPGQTARHNHHHHHNQHHHQQQQQQHQQHNNRPTALPITQAITKQPAPFSKDLLNINSILHEELDLHHMGPNGAADSLNSITCPQCKRCRCEQCQSPRQLPSRWVCNKTCLCSAETVIDYASCLCCVKALFYHCAKDHEMECDDGDSISCADDPCSCLPHKRTARWGWLGALSLALPCLWCYWPMRGCVAICAKCYARHSRHGCRCNAIGSTTMLPISPIGSTIGTKSTGGGGNHTGISGSGNGGGNHHHSSSGGGGGGGGGRTIIRTCDLTPEKRLLDSSPEY